jgi:soluble lytic murein transglycosylase-like protein
MGEKAVAWMCAAVLAVLALAGPVQGSAPAVHAARHGKLVIVTPGPQLAPPRDAPRLPGARPSGIPVKGYDPLIQDLATQYGVEAALIQAIIQAESSFDRYAVSPKGAQGLMQLMPTTASRYAVRDAFDPAENIRGGIQYVRFLADLFTNQLALVLAAYNAGEGAVIRHKGIPPYAETQAYVDRVLAYYQQAKSLVFPSAGPPPPASKP